ncbi:hypothetical protein A7K94_0202185 [Modestobacter sp. VKM Ac-2676]|nr:hypothetical protein A7K94_0202185 [Modestobacter sp. VKM Ac-2676]
MAAFDTATGALVADFRPSASSQVRAIAATADTVYLGGAFTSVGEVGRNRLAAVQATDGSLLGWAPEPGVGSTAGNRNGNTATSNVVHALVITGGGGQVVAAGRFDSLNGTKATGVGALDAVTGATRPFAVNGYITNQGVNSAVYSLSTDGTTVFGTAYDYFGPGNLEGSFAAVADGGAVISVNGCHGDTYSSFPLGGVLYLATHAHTCEPIGGYVEQSPRINKFATAVTIAATGTVTPPTLRNTLLVGQPAPTLLPWFPTMSAGTYTRQYQAGWTVSGNNDYVVFGGEFPRVNGTAQQGLVRYAFSGTAPNRVGPKYSAAMTPTAESLSAGTARISWQTTDDDDNEHLTYRVVRNGDTAAPVHEVTGPSTWWNRPTIGFVDRGLTPGATYTYRVVAVDPFGNQTASGLTSVTVSDSADSGGSYADAVLADGAQNYWRLDEAAGAPAGYDQAGFADLGVGSGVTREVAGALSGSTNTASSFDGTSGGLMATQQAVPAPNTFSIETWFRTTTTAGGKIIGFGSSASGISGSHDRHVYLDTEGGVHFGVHPGARESVSAAGAYNDGEWHHVVATLSAEGMALYVDGELQQARPEVTAGETYAGYWRIGGDRGWAGADWFTGTVDEVAIYPAALSAAQVADHHGLGSTGVGSNAPPTAAFTAAADGLSVTVDGSASADADGSVTGVDVGLR